MTKMPSPFSIYRFLFHFLLSTTATIADLNSDKAALLDFASSLPHARKLNWKNSSPVCKSWPGVTCTPDGSRVMALRLPAFGLTGPIPENTLSRLNGLKTLSLRLNSLNGTLPSDLLSLSSLRYLNLQQNNFSGQIPSSSSFSRQLSVVDFSFNSLTGPIPPFQNHLTLLTTLNLQNNSLSGPIPDLDLPSLKQLNLSNNIDLNGPIPSHLRIFPSDSFTGNSMLCGEPLNDCPSPSPSPNHDFFPRPRPQSPSPLHSPSLTPQTTKGTIVATFVGVAMLLVFVALSMMGIWCIVKRKRSFKIRLLLKAKPNSKEDFSSGVQEAEKNKLTFLQSYSSHSFNLEDLLRASAEVLGKGTHGTTTYAAVLEEGVSVVVKRLGEVVVGRKEFEQQMRVVGRLSCRHPNVVPVLAYYYSDDDKLLVYEHASGGASLSALLHGEKGSLDWESRVKICLGAAKGVAHIHSQSTHHGNIKSSNVVLSRDFEARVTDFGLVPLLVGLGGARKSSRESDVYSFGVLLLELLTGKAPVGHGEAFDLPRWVRSVVTAEVFDVGLNECRDKEEEMVRMLQVAMACVADAPEKRPRMDQIVNMIDEIRLSKYYDNRPSSEKSRSGNPSF